MRPLAATTAAMLFTISITADVLAQSTTISASLIGNIVRTDSLDTELPFVDNLSPNGSSVGVALRVTQALADRWGVELEFALPGDIESEATRQTTISSTLSPTPPPPFSFQVLTPVSYRIATRRQHLTIGTTAWFKQSIGGKTSLVYSAGVGLLRMRQELEYDFSSVIPGLTIPFPPSGVTSISYAVAPLLGLDAQIALSEHVRLVPGIRVQPHSSMWLLRPGIGVGWTF